MSDAHPDHYWQRICRSDNQLFSYYANFHFWKHDRSCLLWDGANWLSQTVLRVLPRSNSSKNIDGSWTKLCTKRHSKCSCWLHWDHLLAMHRQCRHLCAKDYLERHLEVIVPDIRSCNSEILPELGHTILHQRLTAHLWKPARLDVQRCWPNIMPCPELQPLFCYDLYQSGCWSNIHTNSFIECWNWILRDSLPSMCWQWCTSSDTHMDSHLELHVWYSWTLPQSKPNICNNWMGSDQRAERCWVFVARRDQRGRPNKLSSTTVQLLCWTALSYQRQTVRWL